MNIFSYDDPPTEIHFAFRLLLRNAKWWMSERERGGREKSNFSKLHRFLSFQSAPLSFLLAGLPSKLPSSSQLPPILSFSVFSVLSGLHPLRTHPTTTHWIDNKLFFSFCSESKEKFNGIFHPGIVFSQTAKKAREQREPVDEWMAWAGEPAKWNEKERENGKERISFAYSDGI